MEDSPYKSPEADISPQSISTGVDGEKVRRVAKYQRWVIYALLLNLISNITFMAAGTVLPGILVIGGLLTVALVSIVTIVLLAKEVYGIVFAVFAALFSVVPCISLLILLAVNQRATTYLQSRGIKVGFLGASPNNIG